jgi:hypothetical protein
MRRIFLILLSAIPLGGCGIAAKVDARNEYVQSSGAYKQCLAENSATPQKCEGLRLAMEVDQQKFNTLAAGTENGNRASTLTIQNR